ncbi:uncharacterized protein Dana_GF13599 [Drosophila ananassae]|uniref:Protein G12 n=1 Tax=Drosophila ananassae TaxID=7217 RepID=B3MFP5_DROAN|nr:uncharacterized protein LOC6496437 [Drosophila ananassae]EDV37735.2 uncharacterized protein Dana_GF13599 [Drosophila ananassae]
MNHLHLLVFVIFCAVGIAPSVGRPKSEEIVMVEDIIRTNSGKSEDSSVALVTLSESASEESDESGQANGSDDLIFPTRKSPSKNEDKAHIDLSSVGEPKVEELPKDLTPANQSIDLSAFVALIPVQEVQSIAAHYYHHDAEVQRAYAFLSSSYFSDIKRQILQLPEVVAFMRYLNATGFDVLKVVQSLADAAQPGVLDLAASNEATTSKANEDGSSTTTREPLNGLHGLVDSILDILPQDQLLATFFDKTESDKQFAAFVDSIGNPKFAKILIGLQTSLPLRNLLFVLHNNSIYVERIVESLKSYFFLSNF